MARGKYQEWITEDGLLKIESWARDGLTDEQTANNMGIAAGTLYEWKKKYPEIDESIKKGKRPVDLEVENKLYRNAIGYEYEETKTIIDILPDGSKKQRVEKYKKYAQPETSAQIFWLKNRKPDVWRNKDQHDIDNVHANMELTKAKTGLIKGAKSDTSMMESLIKVMSDDK